MTQDIVIQLQERSAYHGTAGTADAGLLAKAAGEILRLRGLSPEEFGREQAAREYAVAEAARVVEATRRRMRTPAQVAEEDARAAEVVRAEAERHAVHEARVREQVAAEERA